MTFHKFLYYIIPIHYLHFIWHVWWSFLLLGPAPAGVTDQIYNITKSISEYLTVPDLKVDIDSVGTKQFTVDGKQFTVQIVDPVQDYMDYMKEIFDFSAIKNLLTGSGGKPPFKILMNALHGGKIHSLLFQIHR